MSAVTSTKHPGFREEREWRIVYTPSVDLSHNVPQARCSINGIPQVIQKLCLGSLGIGIKDILDKIIIGPCEHPNVMAEAFSWLLDELEVPDINSKICVSDIPVR